MEAQFKTRFMDLWEKYFNGAELPITLYYTDQEGRAEMAAQPSGHQCIIGVLNKVRRGQSLCFDVEAVGCGGGQRHLGFVREMRPGFEYFLSCGIEGEMEGERYKKTPEMVRQIMEQDEPFEAPARFIVFKRWDKLDPGDDPAAVIFFAPPDVLSGLFTLANFEEIEKNGVIAPFASGCGSIVSQPYLELKRERQRCVLGMFDVSARPFVPQGTLTFAAPMGKFKRMVADMEESFLITRSWGRVSKRIK